MNDFFSNIESFITSASMIIGGIWVYMSFIRQQEKYPNINFSADIKVIGKQEGSIIVELLAFIDNRGKAQHKMLEFNFDLYSISSDEKIETNKKWGGQVDFKKLICQGSFLPKSLDFFFVDPGNSAKYSFIAKIPDNSSFLIFHTNFKYENRHDFAQTAEKTISLI